jgi:hypothetical protein
MRLRAENGGLGHMICTFTNRSNQDNALCVLLSMHGIFRLEI